MNKIKIETEIKDCPFCGHKTDLRVRQDMEMCKDVYEVVCTNVSEKYECYLSEGADWNFDTPEEAIFVWNKSIK